MKKHMITWDLGATKCAVALVEYDEQNERFTCLRNFTVNNTEVTCLDDLVSVLEAGLGVKMSDTDALCIGASGEYNGEELYHERGYPYKMDFARVIKDYKWPATGIVHDYVPVACATLTSYMEENHNIRILNPGQLNPYGRRVVFGVGTGLGMKDVVLMPNGDFWLGVNEVGYTGITVPPKTDEKHYQRHQELMEFMRTHSHYVRDELLSFENILSGRGTVLLHNFVKSDHTQITPEELGDKMRQGEADETRQIFAWYLGLFVGTIQLTCMPEGGLWITGGVILKHPRIFDCPEFYSGIAASPSYWKQRQLFPLGVMQNPNHAFIGGAYYALKRLL